MQDADPKAGLEARHTPGALMKRLRAATGLRGLLRPGRDGVAAAREVRAVLEQAADDGPYDRYIQVHAAQDRVAAVFEDLEGDELGRLVRLLHPRLERSVESAWTLLARRPYQEDLARKPFRCPRSPETLARIRGRWLLHVALLVGDYDADITWIAARASELSGWEGATDLGWLLAGAIDAGGPAGDEVFEILRASATGEHEIGRMGRHVTRALMSCSRPDAWEFVERLLLSAQRQEGLRQAILESVDESHPEAFRRMLRLIREENLTRFSSTIRAADTWFGFLWDGTGAIQVAPVLDTVLTLLEDPAARAAALDSAEAETAYLALWCEAFEDVEAAIPAAARLLRSPSAETRFVACHFLLQTRWPSATGSLVDVLDDEDLQVAARALDAFAVDASANGGVDGAHVFERLERLIQRVPSRAVTLEPAVWPWTGRKLERRQIAAALAAHALAVGRERMLPYIADLDPVGRVRFINDITGLSGRWEHGVSRREHGRRAPLSPEAHAVVLEFVGDASEDVRRAAFEALESEAVGPDEVERLIELLVRKPGDLRNACLGRLRRLGDADLLEAAERLLSDGQELRRLAGLELLRDAAEAGRAPERVRQRVAGYRTERGGLTDGERLQVEAVLGTDPEVASTEDGLGLVDCGRLGNWAEPRAVRLELDTAGARSSLESLAERVLAHQAEEVVDGSGEVRHLMAAAPWNFGPRGREGLAEKERGVPLVEVWKAWAADPGRARDTDGLELLRALMAEDGRGPWRGALVNRVTGRDRWSAGGTFLVGLLEWGLVWDPPAGAMDFALDGLERSLAAFRARDYEALRERASGGGAWMFRRADERDPLQEKVDAARAWLERARWLRDVFPNAVEPEHAGRLYGLVRGFRNRSGGYRELPVTLRDFLDAYRADAVDVNEFVDLLVGRWSDQAYPTLLRTASTRRVPPELAAVPELVDAVERCRRRIVEQEVRRGDRPTAASRLALELRWTGGLETLSKAMEALAGGAFARTVAWAGAEDSRQQTLSHLVLRSTPRPEDTPEAFARWARGVKVKEARLVDLAVFAPQWAAHVEHALDWPGLESAAWWVQAHTKDDRAWQLEELKELWAAQVSERTPLTAQDLLEGAVDVQWFREAHARLGAERWKSVDKATKYAASRAGHARARLFARAMGGTVTRDELTDRIASSRNQDAVRALGLLPLTDGDGRRADLLERYALFQEFLRTGREFGAQRRKSEGRAVSIGLANLARTAGYPDAQRLRWAMEREAVADLAEGPVTRTRGEVTVELAVGEDGTPALTVRKGDRTQRSIPKALRKDPEIAELGERLTELRRQGSRVREALESAMCRGDRFTAEELRELVPHPILGPALRRLVFMGDDIAGYPADRGRTLRDHAGHAHVIGHEESLRIAHPHDLFLRGDWSGWQRECFAAERVQPFKQVFRELYPVTDAEREARRTRRYAGHQVNPRQALALLGARGWVAHPEEGVGRTFHDEGLTARLGFQEPYYTPADVEGLTLEEVVFTRRGEWAALPLAELPPRVFSETMRDLDLVVSVAHQGGVDPEATASTVQMRASLIRETGELLGLDNVEIQANHAIIHGELATYSVHLGSAGVRVMPGTALPIVAVHSQHRGRLFLPFADDDPRTAEVLSKVLLLARDRHIKDPTILERIRAVAGR